MLWKSHFMTLFKKCLRHSQIHDLCIPRWKNLIFSKGQRRKIEFLIFLPSSIILEAMKKKLATSSFPKYFYPNSPDVEQNKPLFQFFFIQNGLPQKGVARVKGLPWPFRGGGSCLKLGAQRNASNSVKSCPILKKIFPPESLSKSSNFGCAIAHPAHQVPPPLQSMLFQSLRIM